MFLNTLLQQQDLTAEDINAATDLLVSGDNEAQSAAFLALLQAKGVTVTELVTLVDVLQRSMLHVQTDVEVMDLVGTGGDGANTVNISTASSLVAASCGAKVVKHGNRSVSSRCGSADFLEACGVNLNLSPDAIIDCLTHCNIAFCFAPKFHPLMLKIKELRKRLAIPTVFNIMGPLLNPAKPQYGIFGVYSPELLPLYADVLLQQKVKHAMVVHGNGLDELNCLGLVDVIEIKNNKAQSLQLDPKTYGLSYCTLQDLQGGDPEENKKILIETLQGEHNGIKETIAFNAGVALYLSGIVDTIEAGLEHALVSLAEGKPYQTLQQLAVKSQEYRDA